MSPNATPDERTADPSYPRAATEAHATDPLKNFTPVEQGRNLANKRRVQAAWQELTLTPLDKLDEALAAVYAEGAGFHGTHPVNDLTGRDAIRRGFLEPLRRALPDAERREGILAGGVYQGRELVACYGHYLGTFAQDWFGIPATQQILTARYCEAHELAEGRISRSYVFIDYLDLMRQAGYWPLAPSLGREGVWQHPMTNDGVLLCPQDEAGSRRSFELVMAMQTAMTWYGGGAPTRANLDDMQQRRFWHSWMQWYGPAGIGSTRGIDNYEQYHQVPFLVAFPDRGKLQEAGYSGHFIRIGDGDYAVTGGWGHLLATHTGVDWLGLAPTDRVVNMRVMDFYRCDTDAAGVTTLRENWVPIDIPHLLLQMGVDVFGRMRHQFRQTGAISAGDFLLREGR